jgi:hypothetical protein
MREVQKGYRKGKKGIRDEGTEETDPLLISPYVFH